MITFKEFITEAKNSHMTHIEDLVIDGGVNGARNAINALRSLRDMLAGSTTTEQDITVKWDGAPAIFAGTDPTDGKFFVAKKGIFNKNPKVYKTPQDIDDDTSGDLNAKLKVALEELPKVGIKGILQGDLMFTNDLGSETIEGEKYITFHPNTILYAVPASSDLAKKIKAAKIGVVWHTAYSGDSIESLSASFNVDASKLKNVSSVWQQDAHLHDLSGTVTMTKADTDEVTKHLSNAGKLFSKVSSNALKDMSDMKDLNIMTNTFNNTYVRKGQRITDTKNHVKELQKYIEAKYQVSIDKVKTEKAKLVWQEKRDETLSFFTKHSTSSIVSIFDLQNALVDAKLVLIKKLSQIGGINTFVKTKNGFKVTGAEGFVSITARAGAVKLVDRLEFSSNNFSPDIIKGWESPNRG